ncbi:PASTA domain-containing protein [Nocardioides pyridinolyticus]
MDPAEYRDARWYALVRDAAALGVPADEAPALVQRVLDEQRRAIRRSDDPDPGVQQALRDAVHPPPPPGPRRRIALAAVAAALVAVGVGVALTRPDDLPGDRLEGDQVPSLFGYDAAHARALLEDRGLDVAIRPLRACEVLDRAIGSDPGAGQRFDRGDPITVFTAVPADVTCLTDYTDREAAWALLDFANGRGPAPEFAGRVFVRPGDARLVVLDGSAAADRAGWDGTGVLDGLRDASREVRLVTERPLHYAVPAIRILAADEQLGRCGLPAPPVAGSADAFSLLVRPPDRTGCGVRVDVFRDGGAIEAVAYYPAGS